MRFDAVFFDSGGTIYDGGNTRAAPGTSIDAVRARRGERVAAALHSFGYEASAAAVLDLLVKLEDVCPGRVGEGFTYIDLMLALGEEMKRPIPVEEAVVCADAYTGARYRTWLYPGTEETLRALSEAGLFVGMISNTYIPGYSVDRMLRGVGLLKYFKLRIYSGDEAVTKPDPGIFRLAERRSGFSGRRVLYVGDDLKNDIEASRAVGWSAALKRSSAHTSHGKADFEFDETPELLKFALAD